MVGYRFLRANNEKGGTILEPPVSKWQLINHTERTVWENILSISKTYLIGNVVFLSTVTDTKQWSEPTAWRWYNNEDFFRSIYNEITSKQNSHQTANATSPFSDSWTKYRLRNTGQVLSSVWTRETGRGEKSKNRVSVSCCLCLLTLLQQLKIKRAQKEQTNHSF